MFSYGIGWMRMVSFTPRPLYPLGNSPQYRLKRRLPESQSRFGRSGEEKNPYPYWEWKTGHSIIGGRKMKNAKVGRSLETRSSYHSQENSSIYWKLLETE
jgi:hypothetical protein